ncbi:protein of unknown function [Legionella hackeliae]|uniref:Uncharacterized protein n=1 Tax=Legionella hackeliae TaxID=449 RepID=A0A0A8USP9_LEGHA|nr:protein of unknown function [Legionella hackeliae]
MPMTVLHTMLGGSLDNIVDKFGDRHKTIEVTDCILKMLHSVNLPLSLEKSSTVAMCTMAAVRDSLLRVSEQKQFALLHPDQE